MFIFVTRQKENAVYRSLEEFDIKDHINPSVLKDERIEIKKGDQLIQLQRVAFYHNEQHKVNEFITNNFNLEADKIADIYKQRWQIETLFKRLKQNFSLKYFFGDNQNAIEIQIWVSLIIQLIMLVIQRKATKKMGIFKYDVRYQISFNDVYRFILISCKTRR